MNQNEINESEWKNPDNWSTFAYRSRADSRLFVPKRRGFGWTLNFARRGAAILTMFLMALPITAITLAILFRGDLGKVAARVKEQRAIAKTHAAPVNLAANYTTPAFYFDKITRFPAWKTVPRGYQVFDNVPLEIGGMMCLWGEANATKLKIVFPEKIPDIALNQKFETLYVYHGAFFTAPEGTPVCEVVFHYEDGSSATNQLLYGADILDWVTDHPSTVTGPGAARSKLAWVGGSFSTNSVRPLRFCLTAVENPQPSLRVETVDLCSCKSRVAACIMAMTAGRAGLMK